MTQKKGLQGAATGLKKASDEAMATSAALKRTGLLLGLFLLAVAFVIGSISFGIMAYIAKQGPFKTAELAS